MEGKDSDTNRDFVIAVIIVTCVILASFIQKIQKFESDTKTSFLGLFTWKTAIFVIVIVLFFFLVKIIIHKINAKKNAKIWEEREKLWQKQRRKDLREKIRRIREERKLIRLTETEIPKNQYKTTPDMYKKNKIREGQKAYLKKELSKAELAFLTTSGFKEVKEKSISGKDEIYLVIEDKHESPSHIIYIKEITDYLKQFTQDIQTYRSVKPDIVFNVNGEEYAIEVETGKINNLKRLKEKAANLKKYYGDNWFFFVINRNLRSYYQKFGKTYSKRNIKLKIKKIFKNSKK